MVGARQLAAARAGLKEGVGSLLRSLVAFYCIALGIAGLFGIVLFLLWILRVL